MMLKMEKKKVHIDSFIYLNKLCYVTLFIQSHDIFLQTKIPLNLLWTYFFFNKGIETFINKLMFSFKYFVFNYLKKNNKIHNKVAKSNFYVFFNQFQ